MDRSFPRHYPQSHVMAMMGLNMITFLIGLALAATPFLAHYFPGSLATTHHVALGALIALVAIFRVLVAHGSIWMDVVLFAFGFLTFMMPTWMRMHWNATYTTAHMAAGGIVMAVAVISALLTMATVSKMKRA